MPAVCWCCGCSTSVIVASSNSEEPEIVAENDQCCLARPQPCERVAHRAPERQTLTQKRLGKSTERQSLSRVNARRQIIQLPHIPPPGKPLHVCPRVAHRRHAS